MRLLVHFMWDSMRAYINSVKTHYIFWVALIDFTNGSHNGEASMLDSSFVPALFCFWLKLEPTGVMIIAAEQMDGLLQDAEPKSGEGGGADKNMPLAANNRKRVSLLLGAQ